MDRVVGPLDLPLATPRLLLAPLTPPLARGSLAGQDELVLSAAPGRGPVTVRTAYDWPTPEAGVLLARVGLGGGGGQWLVVLRDGETDTRGGAPQAPGTAVGGTVVGGTVVGGTVVGECGVRAWWSDDEAEVGFGLAPSARGRGLATEAVDRLVDHLLTAAGVRSVLAQTEPGNAPSRRLLQRLGFAPEPTAPGAGATAVTYRRTRR